MIVSHNLEARSIALHSLELRPAVLNVLIVIAYIDVRCVAMWLAKSTRIEQVLSGSLITSLKTSNSS